MKKLITIIGTRPQYIKFKPLYEYCKNNNINNFIIDTNQHYSDSVSRDIIKQLNIDINYNASLDVTSEFNFLSSGIIKLSEILKIKKEEGFTTIIVIGDTNSSLIATFIAKKMNFKVGHIEAGIRCWDKKRPEEINRCLIDSMADCHFLSRDKDKINVKNPIFIGDLEYVYLNSIIKKIQIDPKNYFLMTIHRQENINYNKLALIFNFCKKIKENILFPIHHRTNKYIIKNSIQIPKNIKVVSPLNYFTMINELNNVKGVITDSGGIIKTLPFFGQRAIVPLNSIEWSEVFEEGYAKSDWDVLWLKGERLNSNRYFYYKENSCQRIIKEMF